MVPLPDGPQRTWLSRKMPHRDGQGIVVRLLGVSLYNTEREAAETIPSPNAPLTRQHHSLLIRITCDKTLWMDGRPPDED